MAKKHWLAIFSYRNQHIRLISVRRSRKQEIDLLMKAKEFDQKFEEAQENIVADLELSTTQRVNLQSKRINVDFPAWVIEALDREVARIGVTRQSIIKLWLVERLQTEGFRTSV